MINIVASIKDGILTLVVDLNALTEESASKKSMIIATSKGNQLVAPDSNITFGLNVYHPIKEKILVPPNTIQRMLNKNTVGSARMKTLEKRRLTLYIMYHNSKLKRARKIQAEINLITAEIARRAQ